MEKNINYENELDKLAMYVNFVYCYVSKNVNVTQMTFNGIQVEIIKELIDKERNSLLKEKNKNGKKKEK